MNKVILLAVLCVLTACGAAPTRLVYSSGFSFANYDYVIIGRPDGQSASTSLYGMDVEFANLLSKYNMNVVGEKEYARMAHDDQKRTLIARMAISANDDRIVSTVSFDDAVSGRTGSSVTGFTEGDIFDTKDREDAFRSVADTVSKALQRDKNLQITDGR